MYDVGGGGDLPNSFLTKVREKLNRTNISLQRAIFDAFIRHWFDTGGNACDIFKMIRGDRIPESIKLSNVVAHNRLDSGQIPSAIFRSWECDHQNLLRWRKNTQRYRIFNAGRHLIRSEHMNFCLADKNFCCLKGWDRWNFVLNRRNCRVFKDISIDTRSHPLPGQLQSFNVPVVNMARGVMILMRATSITRAIGRGGPWKSILFCALKWQRAKWAPFGPQKVKIFRAYPPFQWPEKCICPYHNH